MAVDKLVDSTQLDADLTSVANAIRTKGGTSGQLAFPAGFVQAIGDISGGGGGGNANVSQDANGYIVLDDDAPSGGGGLTKESGSITLTENTQYLTVTGLSGTPKIVRVLIDSPDTNIGDGTIKGVAALYVYGVSVGWSTNNSGTAVGSSPGLIDLDSSGNPVVHQDGSNPPGYSVYATTTGFVARPMPNSNYSWKTGYTYNWEAWI